MKRVLIAAAGGLFFWSAMQLVYEIVQYNEQVQGRQGAVMPDYLLKITTTPAAADAKPVTIERLVRAGSKAQAVGHVVKDTITGALATTEDIYRLAQAGVKLETASVDQR